MVYASLRMVLLLAILINLTACSSLLKIDSQPEVLDIPSQWEDSVDEVPLDVRPWTEDFNDPLLNAFIDESINKNYDLEAIRSAMFMSHANARINGADQLPQISAGFNPSRNKRNSSGGFGVNSGSYTDTWRINLNINWEFDLWGKIANRVEASTLDYEASQEDFKAAYLSLAGNLGRSWAGAVAAKILYQLNVDTVNNYKNNLDIIEQGYTQGIYTALDLRLMRSSLAQAQNQLYAQEVVKNNTVRTLEVLSGRYPKGKLPISNQLPEIMHDIPLGIPATLLERRHDVIAARRRLSAADHRVAEAKKAFLPNISLTGSVGNQTRELSDILNFNFFVWNIASNVVQPIFQGGRLWAQVDQSEAIVSQAQAQYAQTALIAFQEVESFLNADKQLKKQLETAQISAHEGVEAELLAQEQYQSGLTDIVTLLESQRRSFETQSTLIRTRMERVQNRINLHLALGGGYAHSKQLLTNDEN
ncbi:MAG TPA: efflux transporter outer membrane subunit [Methylococcales bacterium]|nr:efflux transporter outer membrane subunit [Methylococcales bacterium]